MNARLATPAKPAARAGKSAASLPDKSVAEWHPIAGLLDLNLWEGDRYFLPLVFDPTVPQFHGVMPYRDGRPVSWTASV